MTIEVNSADIPAIISNQRQWLKILQVMQPNKKDPIRIKAIEGNWSEGKDYDLYGWKPSVDIWHKLEHPYYTRGILPNELLFDPDTPEWAVMKEGIDKLCSYCMENNISFIPAFSGGKGIHVSIFFNACNVDEDLIKGIEETGIDVLRTARRALVSEIAKRADVDLEAIRADWGKINFHTASKGSQVRDFGTTRAPGLYKTLIETIPESKPEPYELPLIFPEKVELWEIENTDYKQVVLDALKKEVERAKKANEYALNDADFTGIEIMKFPCIKKLYEAGIKNGRYYAGLSVLLMCKKCGIPKEETEKHMRELFKTFPGITQTETELRINNALTMYETDKKFSCRELKDNFGEDFCKFSDCPNAEKLIIERKNQEDRDTRKTLTDALVSIKPSPDKSIRIQQIKEFITTYLLSVDENLAEEFLITKIKKPFDFNGDEFGLLKRFFKSEQKKLKAFKIQMERENQEYAAITFGETADYAANAIAVLVDEFRKYNVPVFNLGGQLYVYNGRIYESDDAALAKMKTFLYQQANLHGISITPNNVNNVLKRIIDENTINAADLTTAPERIVVENGILDVLTGELFDHDPKERQVTELNIRYDPTVQPSDDFENYLASTFKGVEWEIDLFQELFGYCLLREYRFEVFFFLVGNGGNGRTVATNLLNAFLGDKNVSSKKLQEICNPSDVFSLMGLHGKLANICGETGVEGIDDLSNLKAATGRDPVESRLPHKQWVRFYSYAKMIFSMNQVPIIKDSTRGRIRRMKIIDFKNSFVNGQNADEDLQNKLTSPESLICVLNWAIEGLQRLIRNGKFTDIRTESQIAIEFDRKSNPMKHFVRDHIDDVRAEYELDDPKKADIAYNASRVTFAQIIQAYVKYAKVHNLPTLDPIKITASVKYECELVGIMVKRCRDRYKKDPETGKAALREDFFKGIILCGLDELGLGENEQPNIDNITEPEPEKAELTELTNKYVANTTQANLGEV
jgi:putative DNA primase/helicase